MSSKEILQNYINYTIRKARLEWSGIVELNDDIFRRVCMYSTFFEFHYTFSYINDDLSIYTTEDTIYHLMTDTFNELYRYGVTFGNVIAIISFCGILSVYLVRNDKKELVSTLVEVVSSLLQQKNINIKEYI